MVEQFTMFKLQITDPCNQFTETVNMLLASSYLVYLQNKTQLVKLSYRWCSLIACISIMSQSFCHSLDEEHSYWVEDGVNVFNNEY